MSRVFKHNTEASEFRIQTEEREHDLLQFI